MLEKEYLEWFDKNKKFIYSMDYNQAAYFAWCAGIRAQKENQKNALCEICSRSEYAHSEKGHNFKPVV